MEIIAAYAVVPVGVSANKPTFAATAKVFGMGCFGGMALPGGEVRSLESPREAVLRRSALQGWVLEGLEEKPYFTMDYYGGMVAWFKAERASMLAVCEEQDSVRPVIVFAESIFRTSFIHGDALEKCGYGNSKQFHH